MSILIIAIVIIIIVIITVCYFYFRDDNNKSISLESEPESVRDHFKPGVVHDTLYYKIIDSSGVESSIHDSGIKPSEFDKNSEPFIKILVSEKEYDDGVLKILKPPTGIKIGQEIFKLKNKIFISPKDVEYKDNLYIITIPKNLIK
jgi:hypothetical protein